MFKAGLVGDICGRVAQHGLVTVTIRQPRKEHQPPKLGVEGSNPSPPAMLFRLNLHSRNT